MASLPLYGRGFGYFRHRSWVQLVSLVNLVSFSIWKSSSKLTSIFFSSTNGLIANEHSGGTDNSSHWHTANNTKAGTQREGLLPQGNTSAGDMDVQLQRIQSTSIVFIIQLTYWVSERISSKNHLNLKTVSMKLCLQSQSYYSSTTTTKLLIKYIFFYNC